MKTIIRIIIFFGVFFPLSVFCQEPNYDQEIVDYIQAGKWFEASRFYEDNKEKIKDDFALSYYKASMLKVSNQPKEAIKTYTNLLEKDQNSPASVVRLLFLTSLLDCYKEIQDYKNAAAMCDSMIRIYETDTSLVSREMLDAIINTTKKSKSFYMNMLSVPIKSQRKNEDIPNRISIQDDKFGVTFRPRINGQEITGLFDTGASESFMDKDVADKIGVKIISSDTIVFNNYSASAGIMGIIDSIQIANITLYNIPVFVNLNKNEHSINNANEENAIQKIDSTFSSFDVVLGNSVIKMLDKIEFDFERKEMVIRNSSDKSMDKNKLNMFLENNTLYLGFIFRNTPYTSLFDTGGAHGIVINRNFYLTNQDIFPIDKDTELKKRTMYGIGITDDYLYMHPIDLTIDINNATANLKDNCMIPEDEYLNLDGNDKKKIFIGHDIFHNNKKATFDFNNMTFSIE